MDEPRLGAPVAPERRQAGVLVDVTDDVVNFGSGDTWFDCIDGRLSSLIGQFEPFLNCLRWLTDQERPCHVGVVLRVLVLGEDVDDDGLVGHERTTSAVVGIGGVRATGDDRLVERTPIAEQRHFDLLADALAGQHFALGEQSTLVVDSGSPDEVFGGGHRGLVGSLGSPDMVDLRGGLYSPGLLDGIVVIDRDLDALLAQRVCRSRREAWRDGDALDAVLAEERGSNTASGLATVVPFPKSIVVVVDEPLDGVGTRLPLCTAELQAPDEQEMGAVRVQGHERVGGVEPGEVLLVRVSAVSVEEIAIGVYRFESGVDGGEIRFHAVGSGRRSQRVTDPLAGAVPRCKHRPPIASSRGRDRTSPAQPLRRTTPCAASSPPVPGRPHGRCLPRCRRG